MNKYEYIEVSIQTNDSGPAHVSIFNDNSVIFEQGDDKIVVDDVLALIDVLINLRNVMVYGRQ